MSAAEQLDLDLIPRARKVIRGRCPECGVEICNYESATEILSDYMGEGGRCFDCDSKHPRTGRRR